LVSIDEVKGKLSKYIIDKSKEEWKRKRLCWDGDENEIPESLNGEILLEEHIEDGKVKGYITIAPELLVNILNLRDDATIRPDEEVVHNGLNRRLKELTKDEFEDVTGYKKYFQRWRREGIKI
jgi:hypothetical protein